MTPALAAPHRTRASAGMMTGLTIAFALPQSRLLGLHDDTVGWIVNLVVCVTLSRLSDDATTSNGPVACCA